MSRTRGTWNTKGTWIAGVALAAVLALTGYSLLSGDGGGEDAPTKGGTSPSASGPASPLPTYAQPKDWTEPLRWSALPRGERTDERGSQVGFPHTPEGAVGMAATANRSTIGAGRTTVDEQLRIYYSYLSKADQSSRAAQQVELAAGETDKNLAQEAGVQPGQPLPPGAYVRNHVVGYKIIKSASDEVSVWLLARVVQKTGEMAQETSSYTRTPVGVQWQDGDWRLTMAATERAQQATQGQEPPAMAAPGDAVFNSAGWTAIREAS
ncbi:hypothetical protein HYE82_05290 [Streptomyces sp. BR123]|uniref:hypothetical protein n=1 Tax=Streptomyces sp. BR123 TaxID=2749828 RepID=UPI0015C4577E|nr:hypothetical protein [Streptomyces sp. BR123]NXY93819.1 hypothetical protein [Streptomyces sp. BR123]